MRVFFILLKKELGSYFLTPFGWIILAFGAVMQAICLSTTMKEFTDQPKAESLVFAVFQSPLFWFYFLFLFPLLTMRLFSEESRSGTLETLLTAPIQTSQVLLSKYFAAFIAYLVIWIPAIIHFKLFTIVTDVPPPFSSGELIGTFTVLFLMGTLFIALGCLASSLTSSQIIAGVIAIAFLLIHFLLGLVPYFWGDQIPAAPVFHFLSSQEHLHSFSRGLIDTRPFVYYLLATSLILLITHHVLDYRRWRP